jgi:hypothetical protein
MTSYLYTVKLDADYLEILRRFIEWNWNRNLMRISKINFNHPLLEQYIANSMEQRS